MQYVARAALLTGMPSHGDDPYIMYSSLLNEDHPSPR
jgi:hypothetical protein